MKKILFMMAIVASSTSLFAQVPKSAGQIFMEGKDKGKKFQLGSDKAMKIVLENIKSYNLNDGSDIPQYVADTKPGSLQSLITDWHKSMKSLNEVPHAVLPIKVEGGKNETVLVMADEDRVYKNGSTQKLSVFELFEVTPEGKIASFNQYTQIPTTNEFGQTTGGKLYSSTDPKINGSTFQFSNRGEIATMEKFMKAYNEMDVTTCSAILAEKVKLHDFDGNIITLTRDMVPAIFAEYKSLDWQPLSMIPLKMTDTDPTSGIIVNAMEKRVLKDGTVWDKELMETFLFNRKGEIKEIIQFSRGADKK